MDGSKRQYDFFVPTVNKPHYRDVMHVMAYGFLSLSKRRIEPIFFQNKNVSVHVTANATYGMATIWDWDVIIGLVSMINQAQNDGLRVCPRIKFRPYDLLRCIGKARGGQNYRELAAAIRRLRYTSITTSIRLDGQHGEERPFSFIEDYMLPERYADPSLGGVRSKSLDPHREWELTISPWLFKAVECQSGILSIDPAYFGLTGAIERFLYRYARKAVPSTQKSWKTYMRTLHDQSGSCGCFHDFQKKIRAIAASHVLPGYRLEVHGVGREAMVLFIETARPSKISLRLPAPDIPRLLNDTIPY